MTTFHVPDMTCGHCASTIARAIASVDKNARIEVSIPQKLVNVISTAHENDLAEAIQEAGYATEKVAAVPTRPAASAGGCCCGTKGAAVDARQATTPARTSCCG